MSIFTQQGAKQSEPKHHEKANRLTPPPLFSESLLQDAGESPDQQIDLQNLSDWDIAIRYHELKSKPQFKRIIKHFRQLSAYAILNRARAVLGSVVKPVDYRVAPFTEVPSQAEQIDFDLEETVENAPLLNDLFAENLSYKDIWMSFTTARSHPINFCVDTSLSMTGEKLALTAVAIAVVLLEFQDDPISIVAFESDAKVLKEANERLTIQQLIERFLDVPSYGYTHLEAGMKGALSQERHGGTRGSGRRKPPSTLLITDGKYTAGKDPTYLAAKFSHLVVLKMGEDATSLGLCQDLARQGHGVCKEVSEYEALPPVMYNVVKDLLRGRTLS